MPSFTSERVNLVFLTTNLIELLLWDFIYIFYGFTYMIMAQDYLMRVVWMAIGLFSSMQAILHTICYVADRKWIKMSEFAKGFMGLMNLAQALIGDVVTVLVCWVTALNLFKSEQIVLVWCVCALMIFALFQLGNHLTVLGVCIALIVRLVRNSIYSRQATKENPNAPGAESFSDVEARYPYWKGVTAYCNFAYLLLWEVIYIGLCINFFRTVLFGSSDSQLGISFTSIMLIPAVSGVALFLAFQFCVHVLELVDYAILERHFTFQSAWDAPTLAIEASSVQTIPRGEPNTREQKVEINENIEQV